MVYIRKLPPPPEPGFEPTINHGQSMAGFSDLNTLLHDNDVSCILSNVFFFVYNAQTFELISVH